MKLDTATMEATIVAGPSDQIDSFLRKVNGNSWVLGGKLLLSRVNEPSGDITSWSSGDNDYFTISTAPSTVLPTPDLESLSFEDESLFVIQNSGIWRVIWRVGEAYLQVTRVNSRDLTNQFATTAFIEEEEKENGPLGFKTPKFLHYSEFDGRDYVIVEKLPGDQLAAVWHKLGSEEKQYYVEQTANIVKRFPKQYRRFCDLTPYSIVVNGMDKPIGVSNFETADVINTAWNQSQLGVQAREEFMAKLQMDQEEWRALLHKRLAEEGFCGVWGRIVNLECGGFLQGVTRPLSEEFWPRTLAKILSGR